MAKGGYQKQRIQQKKEAARRARRRRERNRKILRVAVPLLLVAMLGGVTFLVLGGGDDTASGPGKPTDEPCKSIATEATLGKKTFDAPPPMKIDPAKTYTASFDTSLGGFQVELFDDKAPKTVNSFIFLACNKFYDGQIFHRVIKGFMNQGGDPQGTGSGGPGYQFEDENTTEPFDEPGLLAMANSGPGTNGSQFFFTVDAKGAAHLNQGCPKPTLCHSIFGKVTQGMDVVTEMNQVPTAEGDRPQTNVTIRTITISQS